MLATARAVLDSVSRPIAIDGLVLELRASIGVAMSPQHGSDPATLLQRADVAMYSAKSPKRGVVAYDRRDRPEHQAPPDPGRPSCAMAMDAGELEVWYQPMADMDTGEIAGLEALLRWRHNDYGSISPDEFIPVAEQTGLIEPLTWWVLETALRAAAHAGAATATRLTMAVNVSARSLLGPEVVDRLGRLLNGVGVPPAASDPRDHRVADDGPTPTAPSRS